MDGKNTWKKFFIWNAIIKILIKILIIILLIVILKELSHKILTWYYFKFLKLYFVCVTISNIISNIIYSKKNN